MEVYAASWRLMGIACLSAGALALAGCGGSGGGSSKSAGALPSGGSSTSGSSASGAAATSGPLTLGQVKSRLERSGYRITLYTPDQGALYIDSTHKADGGFSIDYGPGGQQLYAAVYEASKPEVRRLILAKNSGETAPVVRGKLIFTISGTAPELQTIVKDAGAAGTASAQPAGGSGADRQAARAALEQFIRVYALGDSKAICASLTPEVLRHSKTFCDPASIFYKGKPDPKVNGYKITDVSASGQTAVATVTFQGITEKLALRKGGGQWKIDTQLGAGHLF